MAHKSDISGRNFVKKTFKIKEKKIDVWIKVSGQAKFFFELPIYVAQAIGESIVEVYVFDTVDQASHKLWEFMDAYKELHTTHSYHIRYRLAFSSYVRNAIPDSVLPNEAEQLRKVKRVGSEYFPEDSLSMIMYWYPVERTVHGEQVKETKLQPATESDIEYAEKEGRFWKDRLHIPYEGVILCEDKAHWDFDGDVWFEVALTKETFEFFQLFEENFIKMITGIFKFLNKDKEQLLEDIQKSMIAISEGKGFKLLGGQS